jgi:hypothetical protein
VDGWKTGGGLERRKGENEIEVARKVGNGRVIDERIEFMWQRRERPDRIQPAAIFATTKASLLPGEKVSAAYTTTMKAPI